MDSYKFFKITNGKIMIVVAIMHTVFGVSKDAFGIQFSGFSHKGFFKISRGLADLPMQNAGPLGSDMAAFWFLYFGIMLIPLGILMDDIETSDRVLPCRFGIAYLLVVLFGVFMVPDSGMTFVMLPAAIGLLASQTITARKLNKQTQR